ncbi:thiol:disulfide interchange protein DsbA/DsbL [Comamonas faecalis]|uniref:Thiol:disulfide interchange protein n=1 Tax=Comamonas faecalis TaxID=1387849 RepID=A0ABP7RGG0_9BURK
MKRREFALAAAAASLPALWSLPVQAQSGQGYLELKQRATVSAPAGQIEVIEFFSYGCVHCKNFAPIFEAWKKTVAKDVSVRMVHVGFNKSFEPLQRIFITLETLGQADAMNAKVFKAVQDERKALNKPDVLFPWVAEQGLDRAKFESIYNSFSTASQVKRSMQLQDEYQVEGTPAIGVAGRYYTDGSMAGGFERMVQVTNQLVERERKRGA